MRFIWNFSFGARDNNRLLDGNELETAMPYTRRKKKSKRKGDAAETTAQAVATIERLSKKYMVNIKINLPHTPGLDFLFKCRHNLVKMMLNGVSVTLSCNKIHALWRREERKMRK